MADDDGVRLGPFMEHAQALAEFVDDGADGDGRGEGIGRAGDVDAAGVEFAGGEADGFAVAALPVAAMDVDDERGGTERAPAPEPGRGARKRSKRWRSPGP